MLLRINNDSNLAKFLECSLNFESNKKLKIIGFHSPNVRKKFKVPGKDSSDSNLAKFLECSLPFESQKNETKSFGLDELRCDFKVTKILLGTNYNVILAKVLDSSSIPKQPRNLEKFESKNSSVTGKQHKCGNAQRDK